MIIIVGFLVLFILILIGSEGDFFRDLKRYEVVPSEHTASSLRKMGYVHLQNVVKKLKSFKDPRPTKVRESFVKKGYHVIVCKEARTADRCGTKGKDISSEVFSLWGKKG